MRKIDLPVATGATTNLVGVRAMSFAAIVMLLIQYSLGIWVNLYGHLPAADQGKGILAAFASAVTGGPISLTLHALLGVALLATGISGVVRTALARRPRLTALALVALAALVFAALEGALFVGNGANGTSLGMALAAGVAILCYAAILFTAAPERL